MNMLKNKVCLADIISVVSAKQPVLNIESLTKQQLAVSLTGVGSLQDASPQQFSFVASAAYITYLADTHAGMVFVTAELLASVPKGSVAVVVNSPYLAYASASQLFDESIQSGTQCANNTHMPSSTHMHSKVHVTAQIAPTAVLGTDVHVGAYAVVGEQVTIGDGTVIEPHVHLGDDVAIGKNCVIKAHVNIAHNCQLGEGVRIHAHASIGSEGFGFAPTADPAIEGWERIVQLGRVVIGNHVRIGSQTCIDRGAIGDTVIGNHVIIDNLVQIAHNVRIGSGTAIAANSGIAGSTTIGKRCVIAGAVGIVGHITIADDVTLSSMTMVTKSITKSGSYSSGTVAMPTRDWRRAVVKFRNMGKKKK